MKKIISFLLVVAIVIGSLPINEIISYAAPITDHGSTSDVYVDPSRGSVNKEVTIIDKNNGQNFDKLGSDVSVFFLEFPGENLKKENLAENLGRIYTENGMKKIRVKVPSRVIGEYTILITNKVDPNDRQNSIEDQVTDIITLSGKFIIMQDTLEPIVDYVQNLASGKKNRGVPGQRAQILGKNILKPHSDLYTASSQPDVSFIDKNTIKVTYQGGQYDFSSKIDGTGKEEIKSLTRIITGSIGSSVVFVEGQDGKPIVEMGDKIDIKLPPDMYVKDVEQEANVAVRVVTTIEKEDDSIVSYPEESNKDTIFIYEPFRYEAKDIKVTPSIIPVEEVNGKHQTKEEIQIGIEGKNILIYSDNKDGVVTTKYPIINIGGTEINKNADPTVDLKVFRKVSDQEWVEIDGNPGNQLGDKILLTIPKGKLVDLSQVATPGNTQTSYIQIKNPVRDMSSDGTEDSENFYAVEFREVRDGDEPNIENVYIGDNPTSGTLVVPIEGAEVKIEGTNFNDGIAVYLEGKNLNAKLDPNRTLLTVTLPKRKAGRVTLVIQNANGGTSLYKDIIYVETKGTPRVIEYGPKKLEKDTWVTVRGENFFSPDVSVANEGGQNLYALIGSRVKIDGRDINEDEYNRDADGGIVFSEENAKSINLLASSGGKLKVHESYYSVVLKDENNKYYRVFYDINDMEYKLTDGISNTYILSSDADGKIYGQKGRETPIDIISEPGKLILPNNTLTCVTAYKNPLKNRVKVITNSNIRDKSSKEIRFKMPDLNNVTGRKDVELSIQNPDFREAIAKEKIDYRVPGTNVYKPTLEKVYLNINDKDESNKGSNKGKYYITLKGSKFRDEGRDGKTEVYIGANKVKDEDVIIIDSETIKVKVDTYPWNLGNEVKIGRKEENIVVVNSNGSTDSKEDYFTYVTPNSNPQIRLSEQYSKGSTMGGEVIRISGGQILLAKGDTVISPTDDIANLDNEKKKILPSVFFGSTQVEVVGVGDNYIEVKTPSMDKVIPIDGSKAKVYLVNNDYGVSNEVIFEYTKKDIKVTGVTPPHGDTKGYDLTGEKVDVSGENFKQSNIVVDGQPKTMQLVQFGNINEIYTSNRNSRSNDEKTYGAIGTEGSVELENLFVRYTKSAGQAKLSFKLTLNKNSASEKSYFLEESFNDNEEFYSIKRFKDSDGNSYNGYELIRVKVDQNEDGRRLVVDRGFSPEVKNNSDKHLEVNVPSYHFPKKVKLTVVNPDKGEGSIDFEYVSPQSKPKITNILKDTNKQPESMADRKVVKVNYKGETKITIEGENFTKPAAIEIVEKANPRNKKIIGHELITYEDEYKDSYKKLTFSMPIMSEDETGEYYVIVTNNDRANSRSDGSHLEKPIYIEVNSGRSQPVIESVTPNSGPSTGGTTVVIRGTDFREDMREYEIYEKIKVHFGDGEHKKTVYDVKVNSLNEIVVVTPPHPPGTVTIRVENPDGETATFKDSFTYFSDPRITNVVNPETNDQINTISIEGGQKIKLIGNDFMPGARVIFNPKLRKLGKDENPTGDIITISGEKYVLESGTPGTNVDFLNRGELTVITPPGELDTKGVIVINPDKGATPIYNITYGIPEIGAPQEVTAQLMYDQYIKINWQAVKDATQYEIYVIEKGNMEFVGTTELTSFIYKDIESYTTYEFLVRAIGQYGSSKPLEESRSNKVKTGKNVGPKDEDGELGEETVKERVGDTTNVIIGSDGFDGNQFTIDLTRGEFAGSTEAVVSIPRSIIISSGSRQISIIGKDYVIKFSPSVFKNSKIAESSKDDHVGVRFKVSPYTGQIELGNDSVGRTVIATQYILEAYTYVGQDTTPIDYLDSTMEVTLDFDVQKAEMRRLQNINMSRHDSYNSNWEALYGNKGYNSVTNNINRLGTYTITGSRR